MDADELQKIIDELFADSNIAERLSLAPKVIFSEEFSNEMKESSDRLGVSALYAKHPIYGKKFKSNNLYKDRKAVEREVDMLMKKFSIPDEWRAFVFSRVVKPFHLDSKLIPPSRLITVVNTENDSVILKLNKGVRYDEYIESWKALAKFLGKGRRKPKKVDEAKRARDFQMLGKREFYGLTYRKIAEEYIHSAINIDDAKDTVKKAIKRAKKLRDGGTDITK